MISSRWRGERERERGERQRIGIHRRENGFPISCWLPLSGRRSIKPAPSRRVSGYLNAPPPLMYTFPRRFVLGNALSLLDQHTQFLVSSFSLKSIAEELQFARGSTDSSSNPNDIEEKRRSRAPLCKYGGLGYLTASTNKKT